MKHENLLVGETIHDGLGIEWRRTNVRDKESVYEDNYYYMPTKCFCNTDCGGGYTFNDEHGECDYCESTIRQINGHNDEIDVIDFEENTLFE